MKPYLYLVLVVVGWLMFEYGASLEIHLEDGRILTFRESIEAKVGYYMQFSGLGLMVIFLAGSSEKVAYQLKRDKDSIYCHSE